MYKRQVYSNEEIPDGVLLSIDNGSETLVSELKHDKGNRYSTDIKLAKTQYTCYLVDGENSGEVFRTSIDGYQGSTFKQLLINENMNEEYVLQLSLIHIYWR